MLKFKYMWKSNCTADVTADIKNKKITVENYSDDWLMRPFGLNESPTMVDLDEFFESRCFPKSRHNCTQLLADLGLQVYDPLDICLVTRGRQWDDFNWILFEGDDADYERDVKLRD